MGIWRNIGKIVILLYQIVYEQVKWYIGSYYKSPTSKSNRNPLNEISKIKKENIIEKYKRLNSNEEEMESLNQVEWSENPFPK